MAEYSGLCHSQLLLQAASGPCTAGGAALQLLPRTAVWWCLAWLLLDPLWPFTLMTSSMPGLSSVLAGAITTSLLPLAMTCMSSDVVFRNMMLEMLLSIEQPCLLHNIAVNSILSMLLHCSGLLLAAASTQPRIPSTAIPPIYALVVCQQQMLGHRFC